MSKHRSPNRPRWITHPAEWQAGLLSTPNLTPGQKLTLMALSKRFTNPEGTWVILEEIARETGQPVEDVRAHLEAFDGTLVKILEES
jgi:hypothetical protein